MPDKNGIIRILGPGPSGLAGVGGLLSPTHVITCVHVVASALGEPEYQHLSEEEIKTKGDIRLDFPRLQGAPERKARVERWFAKRQEGATEPVEVLEGFSAEEMLELEDIAILVLDQTAPDEAPIMEFINGAEYDGHPVMVYGVPKRIDRAKGDVKGDWISGTVMSASNYTRVQINFGQNLNQVLAEKSLPAEGFSGSPVPDDRLDGYLGMLTSAFVTQGKAYMIPVYLLERAWPELVVKTQISFKPGFFKSLIGKAPLLDRKTPGDRIGQLSASVVKRHPKKICVYVTSGPWDRGHRALCEKVEREIIATSAESILLNWPENDPQGNSSGLNEKLADIQRELAKKLRASDTHPDSLARAINQRKRPLVIYCELQLDEFNEASRRLVEEFIQYLDAVPRQKTEPQYLMMVFISCVEPELEHIGFLGRVTRWKSLWTGERQMRLLVQNAIRDGLPVDDTQPHYLLYFELDQFNHNHLRSWLERHAHPNPAYQDFLRRRIVSLLPKPGDRFSYIDFHESLSRLEIEYRNEGGKQ